MNRLHNWYCNREQWKAHVREELVPPALEIDPELAARLRSRLPESVEIVDGDGTAMPFDGGRFSAAVCFTMLHHVPSADDQDRLFAEVRRVLQPGGVFTGTDSVGRGIGFALLHIGDIKVLIDPADLPSRLTRAGFERIDVRSDGETTWFRAYAPGKRR